MKYKGFLLATASGIALAPAANAADLPAKAPAYVPPPAPVSWTGFYLGLNLGANWQLNEAAYGPIGGEVGSLPAGNSVGFIGGGQIGYNWQVGPSWVLGIEGSISGLTGTGTAGAEFNVDKGNGFESKINWIATIRGRAGWLMHPDTMLYLTGGGAWAHIKASANPNGFLSDTTGFTTKTLSKTKSGWVFGGGMEHRFTPNWSVGIEALYHNFGHSTGYNIDASKSTVFKHEVVSATVKLNYKW
jgi:outer membrane immunogenic protein